VAFKEFSASSGLEHFHLTFAKPFDHFSAKIFIHSVCYYKKHELQQPCRIGNRWTVENKDIDLKCLMKVKLSPDDHRSTFRALSAQGGIANRAGQGIDAARKKTSARRSHNDPQLPLSPLI
jgi:hypothetical protein